MANSKRKCKYCEEFKDHQSMFKINAGWFCDFIHAAKWGQEMTRAARERKQQRWDWEKKRIHKEQKESLKTARDYIKPAQRAVNAFIRLRDEKQPCISCGSMPKQKQGGTMDAGHYRSRGAASHLRFNTFNIHSQCVKCNRYNSGNAVDYRLNLINKIGQSQVEALETNNNLRSFDIDYLKRITKIFNKRKRHLTKLRTVLDSRC